MDPGAELLSKRPRKTSRSRTVAGAGIVVVTQGEGRPAEAAQATERPGSGRKPAEAARLRGELEVRQIDPGMQKNEPLTTSTGIETGLERYAALFEHAPVGWLICDARGVIREVNPAGAGLLGIPRARLTGKSLAQFVDAAERSAFGGFMAGVFSSGEKRSCERVLVREGGGRLHVLLEARCAPGGRDCQVALVDITDRKRTELELRRGGARLEGILASAMDAILSLDAGQRILLFNAAAEKIFGYRAAEVIGKPLDVLIPRRFRTAHARDLEAYCEAGKTARRMGSPGMIFGLRANGEEFPLEASVSRTEAGGETLCTVILRDITERLGAERQVQALNEQLRLLARRSEVIREQERTDIAREIHDVLTQELTRIKIDLVSGAKRLRGPVDAAARRELAARLEDLRARADASITTVQRLATQLRPVVLDSLGLPAAVEWLAKDFAQYTGIACRARTPRGESGMDGDRATAVFRILQESLTNITRHAQATAVEIRLKEDDAGVTLVVRDNGRGITAGQLADPRSVGLLGMRERAEAFGGGVAVCGRPGEGTTVTVKIPLRDPTPPSSR